MRWQAEWRPLGWIVAGLAPPRGRYVNSPRNDGREYVASLAGGEESGPDR